MKNTACEDNFGEMNGLVLKEIFQIVFKVSVQSEFLKVVPEEGSGSQRIKDSHKESCQTHIVLM